MLKLSEIIELIKTIDQSSIQHFELEQQQTKLILSKDRGQGGIESAQPETGLRKTEEMPAIESVPAVSQDESLHKILAPMIGTFYAASEPEAEPFVKPGQSITEDTIVCVLEAMKLFNEIEAGVSGEIVELLAKNGEFVEYGQPLFLVRTNKK